MRSRGPSYSEVACMSLRVQAPLGGGKSPTSRCPEAVDWIMGVCVTGGANPCARGGGGLYSERQDPSRSPVTKGSMYIKMGRD